MSRSFCSGGRFADESCYAKRRLHEMSPCALANVAIGFNIIKNGGRWSILRLEHFRWCSSTMTWRPQGGARSMVDHQLFVFVLPTSIYTFQHCDREGHLFCKDRFHYVESRRRYQRRGSHGISFHSVRLQSISSLIVSPCSCFRDQEITRRHVRRLDSFLHHSRVLGFLCCPNSAARAAEEMEHSEGGGDSE